jgi:diketogulonate reductase-like aldo/keto reductase
MGFTGVRVPVLGQGTWQMEGDDRASCVKALQRGFDLGMLHLDTAELYGRGRVEEEIVREAIAGRRDEVYLVSKVLPQNASFEGTLDACERSLKRCGTDRFDLYLLHWAGSHPLEETLRAFERLQSEGKIRAFGVSNFGVEELEEAVKIAGPHRIACNQVQYHLADRDIELEVIPWCEKHQIGVVGYSPFAAGDFPTPQSPGGQLLEELAGPRGASPRQLALLFLTRRRSLFAIPKHSKVAHAEANAAAAELAPLTAEEIERLEKAFPIGRRRRRL